MRGRCAEWLLRLRVLVLDHEHAHDPFSPEYLYLLQQQKRLDLSKTSGAAATREHLALSRHFADRLGAVR